MTFYLTLSVVLTLLIAGGMFLDDRRRYGKFDVDAIIPASLVGVILGFMLSAFIWVVLMLVFNGTADREFVVVKDRQIQGLKDTQVTSGSFVLGSGSVDGDMVYYYMFRSGEGYLMGSADASTTVLVEGVKKPRIVVKRAEFTNKFIKRNFGEPTDDDKITLYVPKNTIKINYEVDMEGK